jgi:hypothetical protein
LLAGDPTHGGYTEGDRARHGDRRDGYGGEDERDEADGDEAED